MFSCLQILVAFLWFVIITLLNVTLIILSLRVSRLLNMLMWLLDFLFLIYSPFLAYLCRLLCAKNGVGDVTFANEPYISWPPPPPALRVPKKLADLTDSELFCSQDSAWNPPHKIRLMFVPRNYPRADKSKSIMVLPG